jgi:predicted nucleic acid-binding protein
MPFVLDASVVLAWQFEDEPSDYADHVLEYLRNDRALAPSIWQLELANGLARAERRGRLPASRVAQTLRIFTGIPIAIHDVPPALALGRVIDVARAQALSAYDAAYLELAMREGVPLATLDGPLRKAAERVGVPLIEA